ncbi:DAK2 domain-containing protein [Actinocorallia sp. API 0066]|uniref:DAK2 domain-containing protein n=1 Tax=Actinocorallia sp. API 0066 TaxID=2896846 RepID=UPI001E4B160B|nr:DAK2 domain-containing protein [Actinocorallia sp. API 0066]MCD0448371.1 DAK2 domain-containing protein [Actinocorallia sp. API 0066]
MRDTLDAPAVRRWARLAADALGRSRTEIDALNVFPVPDGDTGTNLHLTVLAAAEAVEELAASAPLEEVWRTLGRAALVGARGNSGVIVSQVLCGLAETLGPRSAATGADLAEGLERAAGLARGAVSRPVEGTILTVLQAAAAAAVRPEAPFPPRDPAPGAELAETVRAAVRGARRALRETPGGLPVLAEHGVVDAGGAGLCVLLDALAAVITEEYPERWEVPARTEPRASLNLPKQRVEDPGYEVMYLLEAEDTVIPALRESLDALGDSLVVVGGDGLWNVHVHVDDAGAAIEAGLAAGKTRRIRVTYLAVDSGRPKPPCTGRGVVAVTAADGLAALFEEAGATVVRRPSGGMPHLAVLVEAILAAGDEVAVLPNEPEVLALAEAAAVRARESGVRISVVPTKASVQGLAALAVHDPLRHFRDDVIAMTGTALATRFGGLRVASGEAMTTVGFCREGDVLGLIEGDVALIGDDLEDVAWRVLSRMLSGGGEVVTVVTGAGVPDGFAAGIAGRLRALRPDVEVTFYDGGQVLYPVLLGVE